MAKFNDEELNQAAADVYAKAESMYKSSEINTTILMNVAEKEFDFNEEQLKQIGEYFEWEELSYTNLNDIDLAKLDYVDPELVQQLIDNNTATGNIADIEAFLTNTANFDDEAKYVLEQLYITFKALTKKEESVEKVEEAMPSNDELPDICYVYVETDDCIGIVKKGEVGYYPASNVDPNLTTPEQKREFVNSRNAILEIDERTADIMKAKSMFGWGEKKEEALPEEDVKNIVGIDQMISDLQSKFKVAVTGSYTDDTIELTIKGDTLPLIDAMDYIKANLDNCNFSDKVNDKIICTITK